MTMNKMLTKEKLVEAGKNAKTNSTNGIENGFLHLTLLINI
ncbi:hypothetical protein P9597_09505 [Aneurinibacillus migulanus]|nr:hypothetical protein [Aneurinibacillus migulanus]